MEISRPWVDNKIDDMVEYIDKTFPESSFRLDDFPESIRNVIEQAKDLYKNINGENFIIQKVFEFYEDITSPTYYDILVDVLIHSKALLFITYWNDIDEKNIVYELNRSPRVSQSDYDHVESILVFKRNPRPLIVTETPSNLTLYNCLYSEIKSKGKFIKTFSCNDFKPLCLDIEDTKVVALIDLQRELDLNSLTFINMNLNINTNTMFLSSASTNIIILSFN